MEATDAPGAESQPRDATGLAADRCNNTPGEALGSALGSQVCGQENNANLVVGNCHSPLNNNLGEDHREMRVSNSHLKGQPHHQQSNNANLGGGCYHSQSNNNLEEAGQGMMDPCNRLVKEQLHLQGNNTNTEERGNVGQSYDALQEDKGYEAGSGDHQCCGEMEVNGSLSQVTAGEEDIIHLQNGQSARGGAGDCLLESEDWKGEWEKAVLQDGVMVLPIVGESSTDTECVAENKEPEPQPDGAPRGVGENGDTDLAAVEKVEGITPEHGLPAVNSLEKECTTGETLEEKERRQEISAIDRSEKLSEDVLTEAVLEDETVQSGIQQSGREGENQSLLSVVLQEDNLTNGQAAAEQDANKDLELVLEAEGRAKECGENESSCEGLLQTAAGTDRVSSSPCGDCPGHFAPPRVPLDMLSPLVNDIPHPLALDHPGTEQAGDTTLPSPPAEGRGKQTVKRVTFPSDEAIVSGAVEPKDPWRHAQNVTVEEIIAAYRKACQKLNCKPINKLLKQIQGQCAETGPSDHRVRTDQRSPHVNALLHTVAHVLPVTTWVVSGCSSFLAYSKIIQEFNHLSQRLDCLDLKGEKLDYKGSEALEEVFKRVQFKLVDLEATSLDEDGASALFDMIEYYESATQLNISFNKHIGTRGWQAAAHMMRKTSCLQYLDARNTPLLDHSAPFVARALRISSSLVVLHLENASLSGRPLMLLATALKMNMTLRELFLADNKLNGLQDSAQLGNLLKFNCTIQLLDLRNNHILDSGLAYISDGLKEQRQGLVTLVLWNNQLTHNGMTYMAAALPYTLSLETLNLGHNSIGNEGVHKLKDGLIANRSVLRLGLASTKLTCEGAVAVAEFIADSPRLLRLDLRENEIKTGGLMALSLALKVNHSLLRLDLDREPKKETVKSFIETQKALLTEIQNGCKRNFILAKEKEEKEQKMRQSASMPEITVTLCEKAAECQSDRACPKEERPANGNSQEGAPAVTGNAEESGDVGESVARSRTVECDRHSAAREKPVPRPLAQKLDSEQRQDRLETAAGKETETEAEGGTSPVTGSPSAGSESPAEISSPNTEVLVSSPGRGHKVFVVTRVESPPEDPDKRERLWLQEVLQNKKNRAMDREAETSSESSPGSISDTAAPGSDRSLQSPDKSAETAGHDFETVCAKDCDHLMHGAALPNGVKANLVQRLPEGAVLAAGRDGKAVSCNVEQEFTTPKTEKELEELLLEASQETCRETS